MNRFLLLLTAISVISLVVGLIQIKIYSFKNKRDLSQQSSISTLITCIQANKMPFILACLGGALPLFAYIRNYILEL